MHDTVHLGTFCQALLQMHTKQNKLSEFSGLMIQFRSMTKKESLLYWMKNKHYNHFLSSRVRVKQTKCYVKAFKCSWALQNWREWKTPVVCISAANWFTPKKEVVIRFLDFDSLVHVILLSNYLIFYSRAVLYSSTFKQHNTMFL